MSIVFQAAPIPTLYLIAISSAAIASLHERLQRLGPFNCSVDKEIADHLPELLKDKLPTTDDSIFVVAHPCPADVVGGEVPSSVDVFEIRLEQEERVSLDDVKSRLLESHGRDKTEGIEYLCAWSAVGDLENKCKSVLPDWIVLLGLQIRPTRQNTLFPLIRPGILEEGPSVGA